MVHSPEAPRTPTTVSLRGDPAGSVVLNLSPRLAVVGCSHQERSLRFDLNNTVGDQVRKLVLVVALAAAACRPAAVTPAPVGSETGAPTPRGAVEGYLAAVRAQDLQALGAMWGDSRGSARGFVDRDQFDRRVFLLQCITSHDRYRILAGPVQKADTMAFEIELTKGDKTARTTAKTLQGPAARWYVNIMEPVPPFCVGR